MFAKSLINVAASAAVTGLTAASASAQIAISTVPIGNRGNASDPTSGFGSIPYTFNIGSTEVSNAQYAAFLNAVAATDIYGLYNAGMAGPFGGITRSGSPGSYTYSTVSGRATNPVNFVSFWDAARFANWLHNGQGNGDTETGAYTLGGVTSPTNALVNRNGGARWALTSKNEWYKAAYHQPASAGGDADNYWLYPTSSNTIAAADANYNNVVGNTTPGGSYASNFYGTFDMAGNVWEWNEAIINGADRGIGGVSFSDVGSFPSATTNFAFGPTNELSNIGFRVARLQPCGESDVAGSSQSSGFDGVLTADDVIVFLGWFFAVDTRADVAGPDQGTVPDTQFTADDIIVFLGRYFADC